MPIAEGLVAGTWNIDPAHSEVGFTVRHLMVSKVRGSFKGFSGTITVADNALDSSVEASIDASTISTGEENRDGHLRSPDFFETDAHPTWTFKSTSVKQSGSDFEVAGDLTVKGVTKPVTLHMEFNGVGQDPWGGTRAGFTATTEISRKEFGVTFDVPTEGGVNVVVGDKIKVELEIEAVKA